MASEHGRWCPSDRPHHHPHVARRGVETGQLSLKLVCVLQRVKGESIFGRARHSVLERLAAQGYDTSIERHVDPAHAHDIAPHVNPVHFALHELDVRVGQQRVERRRDLVERGLARCELVE